MARVIPKSGFELVRDDEKQCVIIKYDYVTPQLEKKTRLYYKFKNVTCACGCDFLIRMEVTIPALHVSTWALRCRKCARVPLFSDRLEQMLKGTNPDLLSWLGIKKNEYQV